MNENKQQTVSIERQLICLENESIKQEFHDQIKETYILSFYLSDIFIELFNVVIVCFFFLCIFV